MWNVRIHTHTDTHAHAQGLCVRMCHKSRSYTSFAHSLERAGVRPATNECSINVLAKQMWHTTYKPICQQIKKFIYIFILFWACSTHFSLSPYSLRLFSSSPSICAITIDDSNSFVVVVVIVFFFSFFSFLSFFPFSFVLRFFFLFSLTHSHVRYSFSRTYISTLIRTLYVCNSMILMT